MYIYIYTNIFIQIKYIYLYNYSSYLLSTHHNIWYISCFINIYIYIYKFCFTTFEIVKPTVSASRYPRMKLLLKASGITKTVRFVYFLFLE